MTPESKTPVPDAVGAANKAALDACLADPGQAQPGVLALVLEVAGHTYAKSGTMVHVSAAGQRRGWLSAGCLEGDLLAAAEAARADRRVRLLDLDNRDLSDVFSGAGAGCRGRQRVLVLPLALLPGLHPILAHYRTQGPALRLHYATPGRLEMQCGALCAEWLLPVDEASAAAPTDAAVRTLQWAPLPRVLILGAGPESELLLPLLDQLGWRVDLYETRPAWATATASVEHRLPAIPVAGGCYDAVLVMAHHFGHDREALAVLADWPELPGYVGLLGAATRLADLLATLPARVRERLAGRLESPAGLALGGSGVAAIALSLAARLHTLAAESRLAVTPDEVRGNPSAVTASR